MNDFVKLPAVSPAAEYTAPDAGFDGYLDDLDVFIGSFANELPTLSWQGSGEGTGERKTTRKYKPCAEEVRERNKVLQRNYRERQKGREAEVQAALESARSELESLRVEQAHLRQENRALETLGQYSKLLFESLQRATRALREASVFAVGSIASAAPASVSAMINALREKLWANLIDPTESELEALATWATAAALRPTFLPFYILLSSSTVEWCIVPSQRPDIERRLHRVFDTRVRSSSPVLGARMNDV